MAPHWDASQSSKLYFRETIRFFNSFNMHLCAHDLDICKRWTDQRTQSRFFFLLQNFVAFIFRLINLNFFVLIYNLYYLQKRFFLIVIKTSDFILYMYYVWCLLGSRHRDVLMTLFFSNFIWNFECVCSVSIGFLSLLFCLSIRYY